VLLLDGRDHPLSAAARNFPAPEWAASFYNSRPIPPDAEELGEP
jgi:hypothetical protein